MFRKFKPVTQDDFRFNAIVSVCYAELKTKRPNTSNALKVINKIVAIKDFKAYLEKNKNKVRLDSDDLSGELLD